MNFGGCLGNFGGGGIGGSAGFGGIFSNLSSLSLFIPNNPSFGRVLEFSGICGWSTG